MRRGRGRKGIQGGEMEMMEKLEGKDDNNVKERKIIKKRRNVCDALDLKGM
jgi:hypothetical protein